MYGTIFSSLFSRLYASSTQESYVNAQAAIGGVNSVHDAVESIGILDQLDSDEARAEIQAVLGQIPEAVDQALIAAAKNAFSRSLKIRLRWIEGDVWAIRIVEERGWLRITIETPDGREFV